jgi:hypothetical protein
MHEFTAPYSSAQNGLAEHVIRTTIDDVHTLLRDSGLGHSYWAEAVAYSINTRNLILSHQHSAHIPTEDFSGKRQNVSYLCVFGSKCWAKIPMAQGGSKLDPRSVECRLLGYTSGSGNYRVQEVGSRRVFVSQDVIFDKGKPSCTSADVGEETETLLNFDMNIVSSADGGPEQTTVDQGHIPDQNADYVDTPVEPHQSTCVPQLTNASIQSMEYRRCEAEGRGIG